MRSNKISVIAGRPEKAREENTVVHEEAKLLLKLKKDESRSWSVRGCKVILGALSREEPGAIQVHWSTTLNKVN